MRGCRAFCHYEVPPLHGDTFQLRALSLSLPYSKLNFNKSGNFNNLSLFEFPPTTCEYNATAAGRGAQKNYASGDSRGHRCRLAFLSASHW